MSSILIIGGVLVVSGLLFYSLSRVASRADAAAEEWERLISVEDASTKGGEA
ncbi:MAG: hypothetical protein QM617_09125 [Comamonas sp.]